MPAVIRRLCSRSCRTGACRRSATAPLLHRHRDTEQCREKRRCLSWRSATTQAQATIMRAKRSADGPHNRAARAPRNPAHRSRCRGDVLRQVPDGIDEGDVVFPQIVMGVRELMAKLFTTIAAWQRQRAEGCWPAQNVIASGRGGMDDRCQKGPAKPRSLTHRGFGASAGSSREAKSAPWVVGLLAASTTMFFIAFCGLSKARTRSGGRARG